MKSARATTRPALPSLALPLVLLVLALLVGLLAALPPLGASPAHAAGAKRPVRVMFVGDSITHGRTGDTTYRYWVWRALAQQGVPAHFVGPQTALSGGETYLRTDLGFETAHAAAGGSTYADHLPLLRARVRTHRPDVIVLGLGFNDARAHRAPEILADVRRYVRRAWRIDPRIRFVLNEVTTSTATKAFTNARRLAVNERLHRLAARDGRLEVARIVSRGPQSWRPELYTYDGTHPTPTGETSVAQGVVAALHAHGVLPQVPRVFRQQTWKPGLGVQDVAVDGLELVATVAERRTVTASAVQVLVLDPSGATVASSEWTRDARVTLSVPGPERYRLRVVAARGTMTGAPGPVTPVVVGATG
ncbi:SGNH/GDSL hydrolase family protein [Nocardioides sp. zg-DK7169]|uniref:SGNH/GDSL hydrolase family protein n=1 Tax=Nocardioides sp. zg-DK7169 TaxID=2736600 RepID=UPI00155344EB|nr:SGNH/GDSL hydrolase family protein [Nocardioides sp. zg-DK7169]NPC98880.1 SGNH/GDSL hydrolase family protein [Nocardioides sp. zg-DK7169]